MSHKFANPPLLFTTRFSQVTLNQTKRWAQKAKKKCLYWVRHPIKVLKDKKKIRNTHDLMIIEMNNTVNQINGVGLISKNTQVKKKEERDNIAQEKDMAPQTSFYYDNPKLRGGALYLGEEWIGRDEMRADDLEFVAIMERLLFKGKGHCKRLTDITEFPQRFLDHVDFVRLFARMFEEKRASEAAASEAAASEAAASEAAASEAAASEAAAV
jgi:hypothetical protein